MCTGSTASGVTDQRARRQATCDTPAGLLQPPVGDGTSIAWTNSTWNPVRGCSRVSAGCENCYAEAVARRFSGPGQPYEGLVRIDKDGRSKAQWNGKVRFVDAHLFDPLRWKRPRRIFVNSMSDLFHEALSEAQVAQIFGVMGLAERHAFQVLTKRANRMQVMLSKPSFWTRVGGFCEAYAEQVERQSQGAMMGFDAWWNGVEKTKAFPNVWLGVSVENQETAVERIPLLLDTPADLRWVSYEPALGPVDFTPWLPPRGFPVGGPFGPEAVRLHSRRADDPPRLDWIVVGGESGPGARPFDLAWARATIAQCREADVPVFVKQVGARPEIRLYGGQPGASCPMHETCNCVPPLVSLRQPRPVDGQLICIRDSHGGDMAEWPSDLRVRCYPRGTRDHLHAD